MTFLHLTAFFGHSQWWVYFTSLQQDVCGVIYWLKQLEMHFSKLVKVNTEDDYCPVTAHIWILFEQFLKILIYLLVCLLTCLFSCDDAHKGGNTSFYPRLHSKSMGNANYCTQLYWLDLSNVSLVNATEGELVCRKSPLSWKNLLPHLEQMKDKQIKAWL